MNAVRVFCSFFGSPWADWEARCDESCETPLALTCTTHNDALEAALGHVCLHHPHRRIEEVPC